MQEFKVEKEEVGGGGRGGGERKREKTLEFDVRVWKNFNVGITDG